MMGYGVASFPSFLPCSEYYTEDNFCFLNTEDVFFFTPGRFVTVGLLEENFGIQPIVLGTFE